MAIFIKFFGHKNGTILTFSRKIPKTAKELELKKMEFEERKRKENDEFLKKNWKWFLLFFICLIAFCLFMSYITPEKESAIDRGLDIFETYVKSKG